MSANHHRRRHRFAGDFGLVGGKRIPDGGEQILPLADFNQRILDLAHQPDNPIGFVPEHLFERIAVSPTLGDVPLCNGLLRPAQRAHLVPLDAERPGVPWTNPDPETSPVRLPFAFAPLFEPLPLVVNDQLGLGLQFVQAFRHPFAEVAGDGVLRVCFLRHLHGHFLILICWDL